MRHSITEEAQIYLIMKMEFKVKMTKIYEIVNY